MKRLHLSVGFLVLFVFVLTGQYMDKAYAHLRGMPDAPRMLFRSRHLYILFCSLLNLGLGTNLKREAEDWRKRLQWFGSTLVITGTVLFVAAFVYEPAHANLAYIPFSQNGAYLVVTGTLAHVFAGTAYKPM